MHRGFSILCGNRKWVDHLPNEIVLTDGPPTGSQSQATGMDFATIFAIMCRIRKWHVTGGISFVDSSNPAIYMNYFADALMGPISSDVSGGALGGPNERSIINTITSSIQIYTVKYLSYFDYGVWEDDSYAEASGHSRNPQTAFEIAQYVSYDPATQLFYPNLTCEFGSYLDASGASPVLFTQDPTPFFFQGPFSIPVTIDPVIAPAFTVFGDGLWGTGASGAGPVTGAITITATEFWEYRNRLNQPVFDSTSGARVNDPLAH